MKTQEMMTHLGQYVFMVVDGGRSFPCNVMRVTDDEVTAIETDHDDWPLTLRRVPTGNVVFVVTGTDADDAMGTVDDPDRFVPESVMGLPCGAAEVFGLWRAELNDEDLFARPIKAQNNRGKKGASA